MTLDLNAQKIKSCSINTACMIWSYVRCTPKKSLYLFATLRLCWFKYGNRYQIFIVVLNDHALVIYVIWNNNFFINQFYHILIYRSFLICQILIIILFIINVMIIRIMISKPWASLFILQKTIKYFLCAFLVLSKSAFCFANMGLSKKAIFRYSCHEYCWYIDTYIYVEM